MIRIAIVEDDPIFSQTLREYLARFEHEFSEIFHVTIFSDGDEIAHEYEPRFDVIFMDIEMGFLDGMSAAEEIRNTDEDVVIIFITNLPQYAIKGYRVGALDYLLKPISYYALSQCLHRAIERIQKRRTRRFVAFNTTEGLVQLDAEKITYAEVEGRFVHIYTANESFCVNAPMKKVEEMLSEGDFFRINKGYLVNLAQVSGFKHDCALVGTAELPVSRARKKPFLSALNDYIYASGI